MEMKNIMNALKKQNNGLAVVTTKKDGSVYTKYFQFWNLNKADKYFTEQLGFKKSGKISGLKVEVARVVF